MTFEQQQQRLLSLTDNHPEQFDYRELSTTIDMHARYRTDKDSVELQARKFTRHLERSWLMSSYSSLVHLSAAHALHQLPETPADKVQEVAGEVVSVEPEGKLTELTELSELAELDELDELPRGAHFGNVLHELLELQPFGEIAGGNIDEQLRDHLCQRYGLELEDPIQLEQLLQRVVNTPLVSDEQSLTLANLVPTKVLKEMPFYLSMKQTSTVQINRLLEDDAAVSPLHEIDLAGYLTGFIDLIFEHDGRFYLLDYKSNYLDGYAEPQLQGAMHHHNYGLQYWIYSVVLHRYLQRRVTGYNYAEHFGGALYLFVRGMEPQRPASGVYSTKPDEATLMALDRALGGECGHDEYGDSD